MIVQYSFFGYFKGLLITRPCQIVLWVCACTD